MVLFLSAFVLPQGGDGPKKSGGHCSETLAGFTPTGWRGLLRDGGGHGPKNALTGPIDIGDVQADSVLTFLAPSGIVTTSYHQKLSTLRGLYRFAINRSYVRSSPLPLIVPKQPAYAKPYIYSPEELRRLLAASHALEGRPYDLPPMAFRALILLLYGAGLRISDVLSLCLDDVDLQQGCAVQFKTKHPKALFC
jgi:site-specific recombinase XerD